MIIPRTVYLFFSLTAFVVHCSLFPHTALAIGMSPPVVDVPHVLRGAEQKASVSISRIPTEIGNLNITVSTRGEFASYLLFEPTFIIPAGESYKEYTFMIDGSTAPVGTYQVPMTFSLSPAPLITSDVVGYNMSVTTGATVFVNFTVTGDQVVSYTLDNVHAPSTESDDLPTLEIIMTNTGNVDWKPESAKVTFTSIEDSSLIIEDVISGDKFSLISPGETSRQNFSLIKMLAEGAYYATVDFSYAGAVIGSLRSQEFSVLPPGSLLQSGSLLSATTPIATFEKGSRIPVSASFMNNGEVALRGIFTIEVFRDGTYEDLIVGDEFTLFPSETTDLSAVVIPQRTGEYSLKSYVKFANRKSNTIVVAVTVTGGASVFGNFVDSSKGIAIIIGLVIFVVLCLLVLRRMRSRNAGGGSAGQVAPVQKVTSAPSLVIPDPLASLPPINPEQPTQPIQKPTEKSGSESRRRW